MMAQVLDLQENGMAGEGSVWEQKLKAILDFMTVNEYQMVLRMRNMQCLYNNSD